MKTIKLLFALFLTLSYLNLDAARNPIMIINCGNTQQDEVINSDQVFDVVVPIDCGSGAGGDNTCPIGYYEVFCGGNINSCCCVVAPIPCPEGEDCGRIACLDGEGPFCPEGYYLEFVDEATCECVPITANDARGGCYDGEIIIVPPDCSQVLSCYTEAEAVEIGDDFEGHICNPDGSLLYVMEKIIIRGTTMAEGDWVTIEQLEACQNVTGTPFLEELLEDNVDLEGSAVFGPAEDIDGDWGICVRFWRAPDDESLIQILGFGDDTYTSACETYSYVFDPCGCNDPLNMTMGDMYFFHDVITVVDADATLGLVIGSAVTGMFDANKNPITEGTALVYADGAYTIDFWHKKDIGYSTDINEATGAPYTMLANVCTDTCVAVPTMGQWGIIALGLLLLIFGVVVIKGRELATSVRAFFF